MRGGIRERNARGKWWERGKEERWSWDFLKSRVAEGDGAYRVLSR